MLQGAWELVVSPMINWNRRPGLGLCLFSAATALGGSLRIMAMARQPVLHSQCTVCPPAAQSVITRRLFLTEKSCHPP